jgi:chromosome segregation ATPase
MLRGENSAVGANEIRGTLSKSSMVSPRISDANEPRPQSDRKLRSVAAAAFNQLHPHKRSSNPQPLEKSVRIAESINESLTREFESRTQQIKVQQDEIQRLSDARLDLEQRLGQANNGWSEEKAALENEISDLKTTAAEHFEQLSEMLKIQETEITARDTTIFDLKHTLTTQRKAAVQDRFRFERQLSDLQEAAVAKQSSLNSQMSEVGIALLDALNGEGRPAEDHSGRGKLIEMIEAKTVQLQQAHAVIQQLNGFLTTVGDEMRAIAGEKDELDGELEELQRENERLKRELGQAKLRGGE